ncbi:885_t:CDS:2, partial [Paraglomus occultum]
ELADIFNHQERINPSLKRPMTDDEIRGLMVMRMLPTSNTFCYALYYISHHPEVKKKLLEEIEKVFEDDPNRPITLDDVTKLKYTEAIVKETPRMRPTLGLLPRYGNPSNGVAGYVWPTKMYFIIKIDVELVDMQAPLK